MYNNLDFYNSGGLRMFSYDELKDRLKEIKTKIDALRRYL
jgi:hypothetical protein